MYLINFILPSWISWEMDASRKRQNDMGSMGVNVIYMYLIYKLIKII